jgi:hypothetical protein
MYLLKLICLTIGDLFKQVWLLPQRAALALQHNRRQARWRQSEPERLDRIRNPSKYLGK